MSFDDLENGRRRDDLDGIFEECFPWLETGGNSATSSTLNLFGTGTDLLPLGDGSTTLDRVQQSGLASTDGQVSDFLFPGAAFPIDEPTGFPLISNSAYFPHQHRWDVGNVGGIGSAGMEYSGFCSSETSSSLSALSSPVSWGLSNPTSPGTQSSDMSFSPVAIATGHEGAPLLGNMTLPESASPKPLVPAPRGGRLGSRRREITKRGRKRVVETQREIRKRKKPEKCPECGKGSAYRRGVKRHMKTHQKDRKKVRCPYCKNDLMGDQPQNLKRHLKKKHPDQTDDISVFC